MNFTKMDGSTNNNFTHTPCDIIIYISKEVYCAFCWLNAVNCYRDCLERTKQMAAAFRNKPALFMIHETKLANSDTLLPNRD